MGSYCQSTIMALVLPRADLQIENCVVAGIRMKDAGNLLGIELHRNRGLLGAIENARNHTGDAHPACCILVELALTGLCCDYFLLSHTLS